MDRTSQHFTSPYIPSNQPSLEAHIFSHYREAVADYLQTPRLTAFEHTPHPTSQKPQNILLFIGGLFDGLLTVPYPSSISDALPSSWTLAQVLLTSSFTGWGTSSLARDVKELAKCIAYFRSIKSGKIVLMGHSTGCQDVMEYLSGTGHNARPVIDGAIIQAPASDREAIVMSMDPDLYQSSCKAAKKMMKEGLGEEILPSSETNSFFSCPVSARRWLSLASPEHDGDDDYFSSDLKDEQLKGSFGALPANTPLSIMFSGNDEFMSSSIDKTGLIKRWSDIAKTGHGRIEEEHSGIVEGASHNLSGNPEEVVHDLVKKVLGFLESLSTHANL